MSNPYARAPHQGGVVPGVLESPHAALLIDFDNVTMGMRSDLSKELKTLLGSDVIKGKVSVQRAYADWRRYPQYIVPLSEASVDLIFAPAYGSNKKNATDIRMAIDAVEMVFTRPEIGTYILLTGDSDFSSLVLKLKEYGKYVIGVGIQESTSDILVQNCDEYYSYTTLTGLKKTTESDQKAQDPWVLVREAVKRMSDKDDVMRSDRLKQVMQELDPTFDEGSIGFSKFSKFLTEASSRGLVKLRKLDNGQYEVSPATRGRGRRDEGDDRDARRERGRGRERREREGRRETTGREGGEEVVTHEEPETDEVLPEDPLRAAYDELTKALEELREQGRDPVRDSDVKRKLLDRNADFDEAELGFAKFSRFLVQAANHSVIRLIPTDAGNFEVTLDGAGEKPEKPARQARAREEEPREEPVVAAPETPATPQAGEEQVSEGPRVVEIDPSDLPETGLRLGPRRGSTRRRGDDQFPLLLEGQIAAPRRDGGHDAGDSRPEPPADGGDFDAAALGLPSDPAAIVRYLTHRYRGVGEKTAESLVERFGAELFRVLRDDPDAISAAVTPKRAEQVLEAWRGDYERRMTRRAGGGGSSGDAESASSDRGGRRGGGRRRGSRSRADT
ncbi:MAG: NYN domain-containing protein [Gemmatimonadetes bacterium]|nr:NYN domain-containing protein [Gemmatimonadota bacterium]